MQRYRITITQRTRNLVSFKTDKFEDGRWKFFDICFVDTQLASSILVYEMDQVKNGRYELEIIDNRKNFVMC